MTGLAPLTPPTGRGRPGGRAAARRLQRASLLHDLGAEPGLDPAQRPLGAGAALVLAAEELELVADGGAQPLCPELHPLHRRAPGDLGEQGVEVGEHRRGAGDRLGERPVPGRHGAVLEGEGDRQRPGHLEACRQRADHALDQLLEVVAQAAQVGDGLEEDVLGLQERLLLPRAHPGVVPPVGQLVGAQAVVPEARQDAPRGQRGVLVHLAETELHQAPEVVGRQREVAHGQAAQEHGLPARRQHHHVALLEVLRHDPAGQLAVGEAHPGAQAHLAADLLGQVDGHPALDDGVGARSLGGEPAVLQVGRLHRGGEGDQQPEQGLEGVAVGLGARGQHGDLGAHLARLCQGHAAHHAGQVRGVRQVVDDARTGLGRLDDERSADQGVVVALLDRDGHVGEVDARDPGRVHDLVLPHSHTSIPDSPPCSPGDLRICARVRQPRNTPPWRMRPTRASEIRSAAAWASGR
jgi:hypothetical protein